MSLKTIVNSLFASSVLIASGDASSLLLRKLGINHTDDFPTEAVKYHPLAFDILNSFRGSSRLFKEGSDASVQRPIKEYSRPTGVSQLDYTVPSSTISSISNLEYDSYLESQITEFENSPVGAEYGPQFGPQSGPTLSLPTVDFTSPGIANMINTTLYSLPITVMNNMNIMPLENPYNDYVSEFKITGLYSYSLSEEPTLSFLPDGFGTDNGGYTIFTLVDSINHLWQLQLGTYDDASRLSPNSAATFTYNFTIPSGYDISDIVYGDVFGQGGTRVNSYQPNPLPDTFTGPTGVVIPEPSPSTFLLVLGAGALALNSRRRHDNSVSYFSEMK